MKVLSTYIVVVLFYIGHTNALRCSREPEGRTAPKTPGDNRFRIKISGNPEKYVPGEVYTVTLEGDRSPQMVKKFTGFMLGVEASDGRPNSLNSVGHIQLFGNAFTTFSVTCPDTVTQTSSTPKSEIQVLWTAPPSGSGCVIFRATVVEQRDVWYMNDGGLSKELCEDEQENQDEQPEVIDPCCACDEAKYEVTFEGLWSRHTHPKDFPDNAWPTRFSDIIGASHTADYRFWDYGGVASEGLRQVAENATTRLLESELKSESEHIRTIIKARGLFYPNVTGKTFAVFRVDKKHHLMSLVSMIHPSPDWIVGVSGFELCQSDCTWVDHRLLNLFPWDAGTDSGITFLAPDIQTTPRERIRRITPSSPNDMRSPFYDPGGAPMKPFARLHITRQRLYEKSCAAMHYEPGSSAEKSEDAKRPECAIGPWTEWSPCSVSCGKGVRMRLRSFTNQMKAEMLGCKRQTIMKESCVGTTPYCDGRPFVSIPSDVRDPTCEVGDWGPWSACSVTCGKGSRTRTRRVNRTTRKKCNIPLVEQDTCFGSQIQCDSKDEKEIDSRCTFTNWSPWSPCSTTCGQGKKLRTRIILNANVKDLCSSALVEEEMCTAELENCEISPLESRDVCMEDVVTGPCRGYFPRWHFNSAKGHCYQFIYGGCNTNRNNFQTKEDCERVCGQFRANGQPSSEELENSTPFAPTLTSLSQTTANDGTVVNCHLSKWTDWSPCSATCGKGMKEKQRYIEVYPTTTGKQCQKLKRKKNCKVKACDHMNTMKRRYLATHDVREWRRYMDYSYNSAPYTK